MSFFGFMSSPVSIPPVFDTTPCLEHMLEYEDCVTDAGSERREYYMPTWPTLWGWLPTGKTPYSIDPRPFDPALNENFQKDVFSLYTPLTTKQKQMLYECEEERLVFKACLRKLVTLERSEKHTSWDTAEVANITLN